MMKLSAKVRYGLLALLELADHYQQSSFLQVDEIVAAQNIPYRYLMQLLISLRRSGIVRSHRGIKGGYCLTKAPENITLLEIVTCLEGIPQPEKSGQASVESVDNLLIEDIWSQANQSVMQLFASYSLKSLSDKRKESRKSNQMYYI
ncbi:RrF2 family transcriptional regulator [[Phormidium] sp. LEGE 05292]|uniref:RrF2 family transcriptional regulator n=1 Tax=[Phormidium] sp. LEGE 05292 TaxID=767427 RepID=UPI001D132AFB|nr:Rrf2 family transcriptional regulator [Phormidium sp. LEGE 05292]